MAELAQSGRQATAAPSSPFAIELRGISTVSYTHLDVYKRQDLGGKFDKSFNEAAFGGAERWAKETGGTYKELEMQSEACLLYTSRCV